MKRDVNIELYRCLLTLGIVILHVIGLYGKEWHWLSSAFVWCVPWFVFITGWFGGRFSFRKVATLYGIALYCFLVSNGVGILLGNDANHMVGFLKNVGDVFASGKLVGWLTVSWFIFLDHWFIHAYIGMIMLAPIVDVAITSGDKSLMDVIKLFCPFLVFVFGWSFLTNYNCTKAFIAPAPTSQMLTLLGVYVVARILRIFDLSRYFNVWRAWILFVICIILATFKIGGFNSAIAIGITIGSFILIQRVHIPQRLSSFILLISPCMFSVFLLHANPWSYRLMHQSVDVIADFGVSKVLAFLGVASITFTVGLIADMPRRIAVCAIRSKRGSR